MKKSPEKNASPGREIGLVLCLVFVVTGAYAFRVTSYQAPPIKTPATATLQQKKIVKFINEWQGTPYVFGGYSKTGIDCSGLVKKFGRKIYRKKWPQSTRQLVTMGRDISLAKAETGDLVFFAIEDNTISHVGIYLYQGLFLHASSTQGVILSHLDEPYYVKRFAQVRRLQ